MKTECTAGQLEFHGLGRRGVVGQFDGGKISSDSGWLLLREVEQRTHILKRLAGCFVGFRDPDQIEHTVEALIKQRDEPAVTYQNIAEAIAAFERTLITAARFDDFMNGNADALSEAEQRGLKTFIKIDCKSCHDGKLVGGETCEPLGKENPYENQSDQGIYALTQDEDDRMFFKVVPLRITGSRLSPG